MRTVKVSESSVSKNGGFRYAKAFDNSRLGPHRKTGNGDPFVYEITGVPDEASDEDVIRAFKETVNVRRLMRDLPDKKRYSVRFDEIGEGKRVD